MTSMASTVCSGAPGCGGCKWSEATRPGRTGEAVALIRFQPELWTLRENKQGRGRDVTPNAANGSRYPGSSIEGPSVGGSSIEGGVSAARRHGDGGDGGPIGDVGRT